MSATEVGQELQEIRALAREFARDELRPHVEHWDAEQTLDPAVVAQLAELGFFGMAIPEAHGGMAFEPPIYVAALEELSWGEPAVALTIALHGQAARLLLSSGTETQRQRWLPELASGATVACLALTEENAGSDLGAVVTQASRADGGWRLTGQKRWVANGRQAGLAVVLARTGEGGAASSLFLVPTDQAGVVVGGRESTMGLRPLELVTLSLEDVQLTEDALLGPVGSGLAALQGVRPGSRLAVAAIALGIARAALEHAAAYADQREQFGRKLRQFEGLQFMLADMATRVAAAATLLRSAAAGEMESSPAMAKLFASETAMWVSTQAVQIFGGYGYMRDYPVEKLMRDAKATEILEETNELQRVLIARGLYNS